MTDLLTLDAGAASTSRPTRSRADAPRPRARGSAGLMADKGIDALVLLANANVSYATGASWPLSDAGRANVERPVAVVLADDEVPHLFTPFLADAARELDLDDDHLHGPTYLDVDEGVERVRRGRSPTCSPATATVAVDEVTGAMHRDRDPPVRRLAAAGRRARS